MTALLFWLFTAILFHLTPVSTQTSNAICSSNSTTSWLFNSDGESPWCVWPDDSFPPSPSPKTTNLTDRL